MGEAREVYDGYGITMMPSTPYNTEENSLAERVNDTIKSGVRAALVTAELPESYWPYALNDV